MSAIRQRVLCAVAIVSAAVLSACKHGTEGRVTRLPYFWITNEIVGGESKEILQVSNGLSLYFTPSNICVWFRKDSSIVVVFDPHTMVPTKTSLETPLWDDGHGQTVYDLNGDGVPDLRKVKNRTEKDIFYGKEWYERHRRGTNNTINVRGREVTVRFDGRRWTETKQSSHTSGQEEEAKSADGEDAGAEVFPRSEQ